MSHKHTHEEAQAEELAFWNTPGAELGEQLKQLTYAKYLKLDFIHDGNSPYVIDKTGLSILDVGGGPVSLLLKTIAEYRLVSDPCKFPKWVNRRYLDSGVNHWYVQGEELYGDAVEESYDEVWMYNVLQHTEDPKKIFENVYKALKRGGTFRFLDWVNTPTNVAHPISLKPNEILTMLNNAGFDATSHLKQEYINENGAVGTIAYAIIKK